MRRTENRGFASWDDAFFTRELKPGVRPILNPDDISLIYNPCESTVLHITRGVKKTDKLFLKGQTYTITDLLNIQYADSFIGGEQCIKGFLIHRIIIVGTRL
uniref:Uncharacterized protein n=1 Tax=Moniliophthora roreri TaxID=221103 RepID=A0A0W0G6G8_MONRR